MSPTREYTHARWHSRAGFLTTTLLVLLVMGAPFLVTRGILTHGALFLPATAGMVLLFGGPLLRLALATGRLDHRAAGRQAVQSMQALMRVVLAIVLFIIGARACGWLVVETIYGAPEGLFAYQTRELSNVSTAWHTAWSPAAWTGVCITALVTLILMLFARRKRLAGLSWLAGWLLGLIVTLLMAGLVVGYSLQGAGALAALAAPVDLAAFWSIGFWGDAAAVSMLAIGAQMGIVSASGRGLPKRASVGREVRILVSGVAFLVVLTGLCGLLLLSAVCYAHGIIPGPEHAAPGVMLLDLVPALGTTLFSGLPENMQPSGRQVTLGWQFLIVLCSALGVAAMLGARRLFPRNTGLAARWGYFATAVVAVGLVTSLALGTTDAYLPLLTVMPALLAVIGVTLARRAGAGMRVVSVAFDTRHPWLERFYLTLTFRVVRPLLLLAVVGVALTRSEYSIMLASFAVAFAVMWIGSLQLRQRSRQTGMIRVAALLVLLVPATVGAEDEAATPAQSVFNQLVDEPDAIERARLRTEFEQHAMRATAKGEAPFDVESARREADRMLREEQFDFATIRDVAACIWLVDARHEESLRLEREILTRDHVAPFPRLDEAVSDYAAGRPEPLISRLEQINQRIRGPRLTALLEGGDQPSHEEWLVALVWDLRLVYGSAAPRTRELRRYLVQRATSGRTLLYGDAGPGVVYLICFLATAGLVGLALMFGIGGGSPRRTTRR